MPNVIEIVDFSFFFFICSTLSPLLLLIVALFSIWNSNLNALFLWKFYLLVSLLTLFFSSLLLFVFSDYYSFFYFNHTLDIDLFLGLSIHFGVDSISILMVLLTNLLMFICYYITRTSIYYQNKFHLLLLSLLHLFLNLSFIVTDLFSFYFFFEVTLIPMYLIIGIWGSRGRRIYAGNKLFVFTALGSFCLLAVILFLQVSFGSVDVRFLNLVSLDFNIELLLWLLLFIAFSVKIPLFPFHVWLPEAHVEAPTTGSVILAGILLKLGTYGFFRFLLPLFPLASKFFCLFVFIICLFGIVYISFLMLSQIDLKKIIAYSSVVHMSFVVLGFFSFNYYSFIGSILLVLVHGFVSSGLFLLIGFLYKRSHTRLLIYFGSLVETMPIYVFYFILFNVFNIAFPGTGSFISEFLILLGVFYVNVYLYLYILFGFFLSVVYSMWLVNRVCFGYSLTMSFSEQQFFFDLDFSESLILFILSFLTVLVGIFPNYVVSFISSDITFFLLTF